MSMGWTCPGCGRCYSPVMVECLRCGQKMTTTSSTSAPDQPAAKAEPCVTFGAAPGYVPRADFDAERKRADDLATELATAREGNRVMREGLRLHSAVYDQSYVFKAHCDKGPLKSCEAWRAAHPDLLREAGEAQG